MTKKWVILALVFSATVNIAVLGTLIYFWKQNKTKEVDITMMHRPDPRPDFMLFHDLSLPSNVTSQIDSLQKEYHTKLQRVRKSIDSDRQAIVNVLLIEPPDRDSLDHIIKGLTEKQINAERLTIDHLLQIRPLLPHDRWHHLVRDLEPRRIIRTKMIKLKEQNGKEIIIDKEEDIQEIHLYKPGLKDKNSSH